MLEITVKIIVFLLLFPSVISCQGVHREPQNYNPIPQPVVDRFLNSPSRPKEFVTATDQYGPLMVHEGEFEAYAKKTPWSSWWFPLKDPYLFQSRGTELSPLEKFDLFALKKFSKKFKSAVYEKENLFDPNAVSWEGLCHAWAVASVVAPEPLKPKQVSGVRFSVGDLKALLIKTFEEVSGLEKHGQRFDGDRIGVFDDIYPDQFHKLLQISLFEHGEPLIIDKDPGVAVWNTPVFKVQLKIVSDPTDPQVMQVTTWLYGASPFVNSYDFTGTLSIIFEYTYNLFGTLKPDGTFEVRDGKWTGQSLDYHPDFITLIPNQIQRHSKNPELDLTIVDEILKAEEL